jgi:hypothetical protein
MREAATLLSSARSIAELTDVLRAAGIGGASIELDDGERESLGLRDRAWMVAGNGSVRALVVGIAGPTRDDVQRLARRLSTRAPHVLWIIAALASSDGRCVVAVWRVTECGGLRIASFVWEPAAVVDSDAETLCALGALQIEDELLLHARWVEILGRDALTRRFYRALQRHVALLAESLPTASAADANDCSLFYVTRLLFLHFLQAKGWLNGDRDFIANRFDECVLSGGRFHDRVLLPLFFGTLNTPASKRSVAARTLGRVPFLNGGLFSRTAVERRVGRRRIPDERFGALLDDLFLRFRFVASEDSATWSEASVDPEMLGRAFESLMTSSERRAGGVFYTPHELVARVAEPALADLARGGLTTLRDARVLDPACGSGAFLVYALERLASMRMAAGDSGTASSIRRDVLARSIFGVDRSPTAVWLCELRLWLAVVIDAPESDPRHVPPLPNLDRNIRIGDALTGPAFATDGAMQAGSARMADLRRRYVRATGRRKLVIARMLDREERCRVLGHLDRSIDAARHARAEMLAAARTRDLFGQRVPATAEMRRTRGRLRTRLRSLRTERRDVADGGALPFAFSAFFSDAQTRGGFDAVIGNPPWVRVHRIPAALRALFKEMYAASSAAPWEAGAATARAGRGFASQVDLASIFAERALSLLRTGGVSSLLLPAKLWRSLAGGGLRRLLRHRARLLRLEDLAESKSTFDAAVYPSIVVARAGEPSHGEIDLTMQRRSSLQQWQASLDSVAFDASDGAPWLLLQPAARRAFDRLRDAGPSLAHSRFGAPRLGVKSGCNAAFLVEVQDVVRGIATVRDADGETGSVEADLLRPALRGDAVVPWTRKPCREHIVWTHDARGAPLARLPERARRWLARRYDQLATRSDAAHARRWWALFRVDAADASRPRVVWADIGKSPRALVLAAGDPTVALNTCYVVPCADERDAWTLTAILNSRIAAAWINALAEPARGGYRRYLGWTVGLFPLPRDWDRARELLGHERARVETGELLTMVLDAYQLRLADVTALVDIEPCE